MLVYLSCGQVHLSYDYGQLVTTVENKIVKNDEGKERGAP